MDFGSYARVRNAIPAFICDIYCHYLRWFSLYAVVTSLYAVTYSLYSVLSPLHRQGAYSTPRGSLYNEKPP